MRGTQPISDATLDNIIDDDVTAGVLTLDNMMVAGLKVDRDVILFTEGGTPIIHVHVARCDRGAGIR